MDHEPLSIAEVSLFVAIMLVVVALGLWMFLVAGSDDRQRDQERVTTTTVLNCVLSPGATISALTCTKPD